METWNKEMLRQVKELLSRDNPQEATDLLEGMHPAEISQVVELLSEEDKVKVFNHFDAKTAAEVIVELDEFSREQLLEDLKTERLAEIVDDLPSDEATDIVADLPADQANEVLRTIDAEDSAEVRTLLQYDEDTAGGIMQLELVKARSDWPVSKVIDRIREKGDEVENLANIFVVDRFDELLGVLTLARLVTARPETLAGEIMEDCDLVFVSDEDQEDVAHRFRRYDAISAPVVDDKNRLLGRITGDDVMEVLDDEAGEDFMRMAGAGDEDMIYSDRILRISGMRLPWLLINLLGGLASGWLLWMFRMRLTDTIFLISFVPVIMAMGGNVGVQSSTIMVRGFAVGKVSYANLGRILYKELRVALVLGLACGGAAGLAAYIWHGNAALGPVVFLSMLGAIMAAACLGTLAPALFKKLNVDPAVSAGPFVTTANDIMAVAIYFAFATLFYDQLAG